MDLFPNLVFPTDFLTGALLLAENYQQCELPAELLDILNWIRGTA